MSIQTTAATEVVKINDILKIEGIEVRKEIKKMLDKSFNLLNSATDINNKSYLGDNYIKLNFINEQMKLDNKIQTQEIDSLIFDINYNFRKTANSTEYYYNKRLNKTLSKYVSFLDDLSFNIKYYNKEKPNTDINDIDDLPF